MNPSVDVIENPLLRTVVIKEVFEVWFDVLSQGSGLQERLLLPVGLYRLSQRRMVPDK